MTSSDLEKLGTDISRALCTAKVRNNTIFLATAVAYPNGVGVVVRIDAGAKGFVVSDDGYAEVIAEEMGASQALYRVVNGVAARAGVQYDKGAFLVREVEQHTLAAVVAAVANASSRSIERLLASLEQPRVKRSREIFDKRLKQAFGADIAFDVDYRGASGHQWGFSAGVLHRGEIQHLFELVSPSTQAIAMANTKIADVRSAAVAPVVTSALVDYDKTEASLRLLLSNAGSLVIAANDDVSRYQLTA